MTNQTRSKVLEMPADISLAIPQQTKTKAATLIALLTRAEGATLDQMISATGWQPHTTRAALTRLKARGYIVISTKADGIRIYRASGPATS